MARVATLLLRRRRATKTLYRKLPAFWFVAYRACPYHHLW